MERPCVFREFNKFILSEHRAFNIVLTISGISGDWVRIYEKILNCELFDLHESRGIAGNILPTDAVVR